VRISLSRTAMFIQCLGTFPAVALPTFHATTPETCRQ
jgi:hypothetical protein